MITSCSPGWINYMEYFFPQLVEHLSTCKSPQQMFGAVIKTTMLIRPEDRLRTYLQYRLCPVPLKNMRASGRKCIQADTGMLMLC